MNLERLFSEKTCPACGHQLDFSPWKDGTQVEIPCPSCGIHFGHDDADAAHRAGAYRAWRLRWIGTGKRWWSTRPEPPDFNPNEQLARLELLAEEPGDWRAAN
jgi:Zn ribbon nucleic-acid-binding protein